MATKRTLRNLEVGDRFKVLENWERDARDLMAHGISESDREGGKRLLRNVEKWRKEVEEGKL